MLQLFIRTRAGKNSDPDSCNVHYVNKLGVLPVKILRLGKSLDFRTEMQGYQCDFGTYTDAGGEYGLTDEVINIPRY